MSKQIRYGTGDKEKSRVASVTQRQIVELAAHLDLTQASVMQEAVSRLWMQEIYGQQEKKLADLQKAYDELYAHHCEVINQ
jgi:hypothetical protein